MRPWPCALKWIQSKVCQLPTFWILEKARQKDIFAICLVLGAANYLGSGWLLWLEPKNALLKALGNEVFGGRTKLGALAAYTTSRFRVHQVLPNSHFAPRGNHFDSHFVPNFAFGLSSQKSSLCSSSIACLSANESDAAWTSIWVQFVPVCVGPPRVFGMTTNISSNGVKLCSQTLAFGQKHHT